jgi:CheY-like chemotaxis protein
MLVAEDNDDELWLLQSALALAGISPMATIVRDGKQVIDYLEGRDGFENRQFYPLPKVVLMDLRMPTLDGFEVLAWMKENRRFRNIPVVMMSCSRHPADVQKAYRLGAHCYVVKPVNLHDFQRLIDATFVFWGKSQVMACA